MNQSISLFKSVACLFGGSIPFCTGGKLVLSNGALSRSYRAVKLCVIGGKLSLVHSRELESLEPTHFTQLKDFSKRYNLTLLADRRNQQTNVGCERRRGGWLTTLSVLASFSLPLTQANANEVHLESAHSDTNRTTEVGFEDLAAVQQLSLIAAEVNQHSQDTKSLSNPKELLRVDLESPFATEPNIKRALENISIVESIDEKANRIRYHKALKLLNKKWRSQKNDPDYLASDIEEIALYLSSRPNAYDLLMSLSNQPWSLRYKAGDFRTEVRGSPLRISSARIFFDTRSAAVLANGEICVGDPGSCIARPVDALLHELIHAKIALLESREFIRDGGMNTLVYPYAHERKVISMERELYSSMTLKDELSRPQRHRHSGAIAAASCVSCVGS